MRTRFISLLAASTFLAPLPSPAQSADVTGLSEIVVTATRSKLPPSALPLTIDVIDSRALAEQVSISGSVIDAVSSMVPSFSPTRQKLSGAGESLRGRSPLYAINGIPQSTPLRDGSRDGFTIDAFFVDRVELIYGSNALQGIGGTGGIVNQVTVGAPENDGVSGRLLLQGTGTHDFGDAIGGKTAGLISWRENNVDATVGAAYEQRGALYDGAGRRVGINLTQGELMDSKSWSIFGRFGYQLDDDARLDLIANRFELNGDGDYLATAGNRTTNTPTTSVRGAPPGKPAANRNESLAVTFTDEDLSGGNLVSQVFFNRSHDTFGGEVAPIATFQDVRLAPLNTLFDQSENRSRKVGGKISYEREFPGFEALTAAVGFDVLYDSTEQALIATDRVWVPPTDFRSMAPFGQLNLALFDKKVRLAGGVRQENVKITIDDYQTLAFYGSRNVAGGAPKFSDELLNAGVIVEPVEGIRAYGSYAEGYTVPDVGRITRAVAANGVDVDTFLDISPIVSNNKEVGVEGKYGPFDASATYFWSTSSKGQLLVLVGGVYEVQRQRVEIDGLEINGSWRTPIDGLVATAGYAHLNGMTDSNGDGTVDIDLDGANISPDRINLALSYAFDAFSARVQNQFFIKRDFLGGDARNSFNGYSLMDISARYQLEIGAVSLAVQNLLDKQYIDYNSDTQRPTDNLNFFAGRGRTVTVGYEYRF
jgi:iron complex outermembrane receptor protein